VAWIRDDPARGEAAVDLHGYSNDTALALADRLVEEAYRQGYQTVRFIHGAAGARSPFKASYRGEGTIKWGLRQRLARQWRPFLRSKRSPLFQVADASLTVALLPNPKAGPRVGLGSVPPSDYEVEARRGER
jgi:hypothetical protein